MDENIEWKPKLTAKIHAWLAGLMKEIYKLRSSAIPDSAWREVSKADWIRAERGAGFRPKMSSDDPRWWDTCATGGFGNNSIEGKIEYLED